VDARRLNLWASHSDPSVETAPSQEITVQLVGSRPLAVLPMIILPIVLAWDAGAVTLTHMSVPDDAQQAGQAAAQAIQYMTSPTPDEAQAAFTAAQGVTNPNGETINPTTFTIYQDGSVTLTVSRSTDTLLFKYLPFLSGLDKTSTTVTVDRATY
jgi:hypothetical protein